MNPLLEKSRHRRLKALVAFSVLAFSLAISLKATAQVQNQESSGIELSGYVDLFYQRNSNGQPRSGNRVFDSFNNVTNLQDAELSFRKKAGPLGLRLDLVFGQQADELAGLNVPRTSDESTPPTLSAVSEPTRNIAQAFLTYTPDSLPTFTFTAGKFYSFTGYEVPRAKDNWNYSRSLSFNFAGPLWHQGVSFGYKVIPDTLGVTAYMVNGWDGRVVNEANKSQTLGAAVNYTPSKNVTVNYSYMGGPETGSSGALRQLHDLNATVAFNETLSLAADLTLGSQKDYIRLGNNTVNARWLGWAVYARVGFLEKFGLAARYERFDDRDGAAFSEFSEPGSQPAIKVSSTTATLSYLINPTFEGRAEFRTDKADKKTSLYTDSRGAQDDSENTLTLALLAGF